MAWLDNFHTRIKITITNSGAVQNECPVGVEIDTAALVTAGLMFDDGREIRFTGNDEVTTIPFALLSDMNSTATKFGVRVDIPEGESFIYLYFNHVCKTVESISDANYWYSSYATEASPVVTADDVTTTVYLGITGPDGSGVIDERFSPTFNALNIQRLDFDIHGRFGGEVVTYAEHWLTITGGDEIFYRKWSRIPYDPWNEQREYNMTGLTGIHELNCLLRLTYNSMGNSGHADDIITVVLTNHTSISVSQGGTETCPDPPTPDMYYVKISGDDGSSGTSFSNAWATLTHGFDTMPGDNANVLRVDEGTHDVWENTGPAQCTNIVGGYHDGTWHDWVPGCGHDRPLIVACGKQFDNAEITLEGIDFDCELGPAMFTGVTYPCVFTNCKYTGMMYTDNARVVFINALNDIFHVSADGNVTTITPDHYQIIGDDSFDTYDSRNVIIATDGDIDMIIDTWSESEDQNKAWQITADGDRTIGFTLGDMLPRTKYNLKVDGVIASYAMSDNTGVIIFPDYNGTFSEKLFETEIKLGEMIDKDSKITQLISKYSETDSNISISKYSIIT